MRKFWVKPGEERWLIAQFARHLPVLFPFEKAGKFGRAEWLPAAALDDPARRERAIEDVLRRSTGGGRWSCGGGRRRRRGADRSSWAICRHSRHTARSSFSACLRPTSPDHRQNRGEGPRRTSG